MFRHKSIIALVAILLFTHIANANDTKIILDEFTKFQNKEPSNIELLLEYAERSDGTEEIYQYIYSEFTKSLFSEPEILLTYFLKSRKTEQLKIISTFIDPRLSQYMADEEITPLYVKRIESIRMVKNNQFKELVKLIEDELVIGIDGQFSPIEEYSNIVSSMHIGQEKYKVTVSSVLDKYTSYYWAKNLLDHDKQTAWCEGVDGAGIDEKIDFEIYTSELCKETGCYVKNISFAILPGYTKNQNIYASNARPKKLHINVEYSNIPIATLKRTLSDLSEEQIISIPIKVNIDNIRVPIKTRIQIESIYPGNKYTDLCISEIHYKLETEGKSIGY